MAPSTGYERIARLIAERRCVILDGGVGTEVSRAAGTSIDLDRGGWATRALIEAPRAIGEVHREYLDAGCDVISTNSWGLVAGGGLDASSHSARPLSWIDLARRSLDLARTAVEDSGRGGECAVAFSLDGQIDSEDGREATRLLARLFDDGPAPDLILVETLTHLRPSLYEAVRELRETGLPVWLSFRRCRHGLCGAYGEHLGGPEGDAFGRAARELEQAGIEALLVNCVPPDHVDGMVSYLRDFTDLPLGVYPNLGYLSDSGWQDAGGNSGDYGELALRWRAEGAQIIGGCCGVGPADVRSAVAALDGTAEGRSRPQEPGSWPAANREPEAPPAPWLDKRGRSLYPLEFPELAIEDGVAAPDAAGLMAWQYLARNGVGAHQRCLDVGCGSGLLAIQLALNGASFVRAIDISPEAVANTSTNAYRNGVDDRIDAALADLYPWTPEERFDLIVANLDQEPTDSLEAEGAQRRADFWGRGSLDQLVAKLGEALAADGVAYLVQTSILSQHRTAALLARHGLVAEVAEFSVFGFPEAVRRNHSQIERVEQLSDAYHLRVGGSDALVAYLLEVRKDRA